jgi:hypothetical protein
MTTAGNRRRRTGRPANPVPAGARVAFYARGGMPAEHGIAESTVLESGALSADFWERRARRLHLERESRREPFTVARELFPPDRFKRCERCSRHLEESPVEILCTGCLRIG